MEVECLVALDDRVAGAHLHDTNLVLDRHPLLLILGLCELQGKQFAVADTLATEDASKATRTFLSDDFVELRRILILNVC